MSFRKIKKIAAFAAITVLSVSTAFTKSNVSFAAEETGEVILEDTGRLEQVESGRKGSIGIRITDGKKGTSKEGVRFYCTRVADVEDGEYVLLNNWKETGVDLNAVQTADELKTAAEKLTEKKITEDKETVFGKTDSSGEIRFTDLKVGVYLIQAEDSEAYDTVEPSLIAIPTWSESEEDMLYDVTMQPKHTPKPGKLIVKAPQTGLKENTPYYLAGAAVCLLAGGILIGAGRKRRERMADKIRKGLAGILILLGCLCLWKAYKEHKPFADARIKQEAAVTAAVVESENPMDRRIDFELLKRINPDIIGWLYAPQIGVDQPVLKGENDTEYLNKNFEGNYSPLGSVFTWAYTDEKLSDRHICLFGHNMMSGQIFGQLEKYEDEKFQKEYKQMYLYTPERTKELEIQSVFVCLEDDAVFQKEWEKGKKEQVVTLATCTGYDGTPYRLVVNCRTAKEKTIL